MSPEHIAAKIMDISRELLSLGTGPLAELRRMRPGDIGPPAYWRIAANCGLPPNAADNWMQIVKIMAILAPKGERDTQTRIHGSHALGRALCDGGDPGWKPENPLDPRGLFSEERLNRLTLAPPGSRAEALERVMLRLARTRSPQTGINCAELARLILDPDDPAPMRKLAYDYFSRLDQKARKSESTEEGTAQ